MPHQRGGLTRYASREHLNCRDVRGLQLRERLATVAIGIDTPPRGQCTYETCSGLRRMGVCLVIASWDGEPCELAVGDSKLSKQLNQAKAIDREARPCR